MEKSQILPECSDALSNIGIPMDQDDAQQAALRGARDRDQAVSSALLDLDLSQTIEMILLIVDDGDYDALEGINHCIDRFGQTPTNDLWARLSPPAIKGIAKLAVAGYPQALNAIAGLLSTLSTGQVAQLLEDTAIFILIIEAADCGYTDALDALSQSLQRFARARPKQLQQILRSSPRLLVSIEDAVEKGFTKLAVVSDLFFGDAEKTTMKRASHIDHSLLTGTAEEISIDLLQLASEHTVPQVNIFTDYDSEEIATNKDLLLAISERARHGHAQAIDRLSQVFQDLTLSQLQLLLRENEDVFLCVRELAYAGYPEAFQAMGEILARSAFEHPAQLRLMLTAAPYLLSDIAEAACRGYPEVLNAISPVLSGFARYELYQVLYADSRALCGIAQAACHGHSYALEIISEVLGTLDPTQLYKLLSSNKKTLPAIAQAACHKSPAALNAISETLSNQDLAHLLYELLQEEEDIGFLGDNNALGSIVEAACVGFPDALNAISAVLGCFEPDQLYELVEKDISILRDMILAANSGNPSAFVVVARAFCSRADGPDCLRAGFSQFMAVDPSHSIEKQFGLVCAFAAAELTDDMISMIVEDSRISADLIQSVFWLKKVQALDGFAEVFDCRYEAAGAEIDALDCAGLYQLLSLEVLPDAQNRFDNGVCSSFIQGLAEYCRSKGHLEIANYLCALCAEQLTAYKSVGEHSFFSPNLDTLTKRIKVSC